MLDPPTPTVISKTQRSPLKPSRTDRVDDCLLDTNQAATDAATVVDVGPGSTPLYVHYAAAAAIEIFRRAELVGSHPVYLLGVEIPPHRGGPALVALLTLADGRLLAARSRPYRGKKNLNILFDMNTANCDVEDLRRFSGTWYDTLGGFAPFALDAIDSYGAAAALVADAFMAPSLGRMVTQDLAADRPDSSLPWDASTAAVMSLTGVVCAVVGFTPDLASVEDAGLPDDLQQAMTLPEPALDDRLELWARDIAGMLGPEVLALLREAGGLRLSSPRASVVLSRSAAEAIVSHLSGEASSAKSLNERINHLKKRWDLEPPTGRPGAQARERAWRESVVACLQSAREIGNLVHRADPVTIDDARWCRSIMERLVEAVLRQGPLDSPRE